MEGVEIVAGKVVSERNPDMDLDEEFDKMYGDTGSAQEDADLDAEFEKTYGQEPSSVPAASDHSAPLPSKDGDEGEVVQMSHEKPGPRAVSTTGGNEEKVEQIAPNLFMKGDLLFDSENRTVKPGQFVVLSRKDGTSQLLSFNGANKDGKPVFEDVRGVSSLGADIAGRIDIGEDDFDTMLAGGKAKRSRSPLEQVRLGLVAETGDEEKYAPGFVGTARAVVDRMLPYAGRHSRDLSMEQLKHLANIHEGKLDGYAGKNDDERLGVAAADAGLDYIRPGETREAYSMRIRAEADEMLKKRSKAKELAGAELGQTEASAFDKIVKGGVESGGYALEFALPGGVFGKAGQVLGMGRKALRVVSALGSAVPVVAAESRSRYVENTTPEYGVDEHGELERSAAPDSESEAAYKAIGGAALDTAVEIGLESATMGLLRLVGKPAGMALGKMTPRAVKDLGERTFNRFMASETGAALRSINRARQDFTSLTQINSPFGELMEENVQAFEKVLNLDGKTSEYKGFEKELKDYWDRQADWDTQWDIFYGLVAQLAIGAAKSTSDGLASRAATADARRDVRMALARSGISEGAINSLTTKQQKVLTEMWRRYSADPDALKDRAKNLGISMRAAVDELTSREGIYMARSLEQRGIAPEKFAVQVGADGKPAFHRMNRFASDGKSVPMNAMVDEGHGVTIVDQGDGTFYVMNDQRGFTARMADGFAAAKQLADNEVMDNQRRDADNEKKAQYLANLAQGMYTGRDIKVVPTEAALRWGLASAFKNGETPFGLVDAAQVFDADGRLKQQGAGGFHTPDGTVVVILDNVASPSEMERVLAHEATGHEGVESNTGRGENTVEFIRNAKADGFERYKAGERARYVSALVRSGMGEEAANAVADEAMSTDSYQKEAMARYAQGRLHRPTWHERKKHEANEKRRADGESVPFDQADMEVMLAKAEEEGRSPGGKFDIGNADSGVRYFETEQEAADETGDVRDEAPAQPEQGAPEPAGGEAARPVEAQPQGGEAPRHGAVEPAKTGSDVAEAPTEAPPPMRTEHDFLRVMHDNQKPVRVPVGEIALPDTQFKEGADPKTGVVKGQELKGEYFESAENAVVVYVRKDGTKELVTGRHRFDLAKRNGKNDILARVFREVDGYTPEDMRNLDAISNIIDEKGTEHDYIRYFDSAKPTRAEAESAGFLSRPKGRNAYELYEGATEGTRAAIDWSGSGADGLISPEQAGIIAKAAPRDAHPRNGAVQRILVKKAQDGLRGDRLAIVARSLAEEAKRRKAPAADGETQLDLFTSEEDLALLALEEKRAAKRVEKANEYGRVASVLQTAMQKGGRLDLNKAYARELGIKNPKDRKQLADARQKALEKADYWRNAVRLDEADKAALDAELGIAPKENLELESVTGDQIAEENRKRAEKEEIERRKAAPLKGGAGEVGQSLMDLGGAEGEDLFNRTQRPEPVAEKSAEPARPVKVAQATASKAETAVFTGKDGTKEPIEGYVAPMEGDIAPKREVVIQHDTGGEINARQKILGTVKSIGGDRVTVGYRDPWGNEQSDTFSRSEIVGVKPLPQTRENGPVSAPKEAGATTPPRAAKPAEGRKSGDAEILKGFLTAETPAKPVAGGKMPKTPPKVKPTAEDVAKVEEGLRQNLSMLEDLARIVDEAAPNVVKSMTDAQLAATLADTRFNTLLDAADRELVLDEAAKRGITPPASPATPSPKAPKTPSVRMKDEAAERKAKAALDAIDFDTPELDGLKSKIRNGTILTEADQRQFAEDIRKGRLRYPRFRADEIAASTGKEHGKLWQYILSLESARMDGRRARGGSEVYGRAASQVRRGGSEWGRVGTGSAQSPSVAYSQKYRKLDSGTESEVFDTGDGWVVKVRQIHPLSIGDVIDELAKVVYHNYLFPGEKYVLDDIVRHEHDGYREFYLILRQPFVTPKTENGRIVQPTYAQIWQLMKSRPQGFTFMDLSSRPAETGEYGDYSSSDGDDGDAVPAVKKVAYNRQFVVYDFQPGRNTFIDAKTGKVRFIDPRIDINDPGAGFRYSKYGTRRKFDGEVDLDTPELGVDSTIVSGDEVRKTMPGYNRLDWSTHVDRTGYVGPRLEAQFQRLLKERKGKGDGTVVFLAGGNGAGKSTVAAKIGNSHDFAIDSTLGNLEVAKKQIDAILANGQTPEIHFVYRTTGQALEGIAQRVKNGGHIVSPLSFANSHVKSSENLRLLSEAYGDKIHLHIYDNSVDGAPEITLKQLEAKGKPDHERIRESANYYLGHLREREEARSRSQGGVAGGGAKGEVSKVDFDTPDFDPERFGKLVTGVGKLVDVLVESGHRDFKSLATYIYERDAEKYGRAKPVLRGIWNAVARARGLSRVGDAEADSTFASVENPESQESKGDQARRIKSSDTQALILEDAKTSDGETQGLIEEELLSRGYVRNRVRMPNGTFRYRWHPKGKAVAEPLKTPVGREEAAGRGKMRPSAETRSRAVSGASDGATWRDASGKERKWPGFVPPSSLAPKEGLYVAVQSGDGAVFIGKVAKVTEGGVELQPQDDEAARTFPLDAVVGVRDPAVPARRRSVARPAGEVDFYTPGLYTGSAADYERPSLHYVGTGEGNQVYGWGLYASDRRGVAEGYANSDAKRRASTPDEMWPKYKGKFDSELEHDPVRTFALKYVAREGSVDAAIQFLRTDDWTERADPKAREAAEWLEKNRDDVTPPQTPSEHLYEQTWFTDRAPGDESHLLKWYEPVSEEQKAWIEEQAKKEGFVVGYSIRGEKYIAGPNVGGLANSESGIMPEYWQTGEDAYRAIGRLLGSPKAASEFLARAGIDGVKYPVDSYGKAVKDGDETGWNYVSFRDDNIRVDHKWADGEIQFDTPELSPEGRREHDEVVARYTNADGTKKPGWMKAPNGKPTKLTERQWAQVRTPSFKKWFGDWERLAELYAARDFALNSEPVAEVSGNDFQKDPTGANTLIDRVADYFAELGGKAESPDLGTVELTRRGVKSSVAHGIGAKKAAAFAAVKDVIEKGVVFDRNDDWKGRGYATAAIAAPIRMGGKDYVCELIVNRYKDRNAFYLHEVNLKEKLSDTIKTATGAVSIGEPARPVMSIIAQRLAEVNPASVSKVVDENGEPLVVWHGSEKRFSEFSNKLIGSHTDANGHDGVGVWGRGHYFSDRKDLAEEYQRGNPDGQTIATFLDIRNPMPKEEVLRIANEAWDYADPDGKNYYREYQRLIDESVRKNDYDGVMAKGKHATEYVAFSHNQIKSATGNNGDFSRTKADINFDTPELDPMRRAEEVNTYARRYYERHKALRALESPTRESVMDAAEGRWQKFRRALQDKNLVIREVEERLGVTDKRQSVYYAKDREFGLNEHQLGELQRRRVEPIFDALADVGVGQEAFDLYLIARHAPYRNALVRGRNGTENGSGMSDADADAVIGRFRALGVEGELARIADMVYDMNDEALQRLVDSGRLSQEDADGFRAAQADYVPLRTDMEDADRDAFNTSTSGWKKNEFHAAKGRDTLADSPLAWSIVQAERAIKASNANVTRQAAAALVRHAEKIGKPIGEIVPAHKFNKRWAFDIGDEVWTADALKDRPDLIFFKEDGRLKAIKVDGGKNALGITFAKAVTDKDLVQFSKWFEWVPKLTRAMSAMRTQYVPTFILRNMKADTLEAMLNVFSERGLRPGLSFGKRLLASEWKNRKDVKDYFRTGEARGWMKEFVENGGLTGGGMAAEGFSEAAKRIQKTLRKHGGGARGLAAAVPDAISLLNACAEYNTRLGIYTVLREEGVGVEDAISYARDATVNFNRKGYLTPYTNAAFMFSNAAIQGMSRAFKSMGAKHGKGTLAALFMVGVIQTLLDHWLGDDDDREKKGLSNAKNMTEHDKQTSLGVPLPGGRRLKAQIRNPWALPVYLGRKTAELAIGAVSAARAAKDVASAVGGFITEPVGGNGFDSISQTWQTFAPTLADPLVQWMTGTDFKGDERLRKKWDDNLPSSWNGRRNTAAPYKWIAQGLNALSGGGEFRKGAFDTSPENWQLLAETVLGGALTDLNRVASAVADAWDAAQGAKPDQVLRDVPFVRDTVTNMPDVSRRYYESFDAYDADRTEFRGVKGADGRLAFAARHPWVMDDRVKRLDKEIRELGKMEQGLEKKGGEWVAAERTPKERLEFRRKRLAKMAEFVGIMEEKPSGRLPPDAEYRILTQAFSEAKKEYETIQKDPLLETKHRKSILDEMRGSNPLLVDKVRLDVEDEIKEVKKSESELKKMREDGTPEKYLKDAEANLQKLKDNVLKLIRENRRAE